MENDQTNQEMQLPRQPEEALTPAQPVQTQPEAKGRATPFRLLRIAITLVLALGIGLCALAPLYGSVFQIPTVNLILEKQQIQVEEYVDVAELAIDGAREMLGLDEAYLDAAQTLAHERSFMALRAFVAELEEDASLVGFAYNIALGEDVGEVLTAVYWAIWVVFALAALLVLLSGIFKPYWLMAVATVFAAVVLGALVNVGVIFVLLLGQIGQLLLLLRQKKALAQ